MDLFVVWEGTRRDERRSSTSRGRVDSKMGRHGEAIKVGCCLESQLYPNSEQIKTSERYLTLLDQASCGRPIQARDYLECQHFRGNLPSRLRGVKTVWPARDFKNRLEFKMRRAAYNFVRGIE